MGFSGAFRATQEGIVTLPLQRSQQKMTTLTQGEFDLAELHHREDEVMQLGKGSRQVGSPLVTSPPPPAHCLISVSVSPQGLG